MAIYRGFSRPTPGTVQSHRRADGSWQREVWTLDVRFDQWCWLVDRRSFATEDAANAG
jgi:hypothetical protein